MGEDEEGNIIAELNARFQELRTLMITIGSVIAMMLAGLNQVGFIDFIVDGVVDVIKDDPEWNPYIPDCVEEWDLIADHYVIEDDVLFNVHLMDLMWCNSIHTVNYNISLDDKEMLGTSPEFRNEYEFVVTITNISEGTHRAYVQVSNGTMDLLRMITLDFEYDEIEMEAAVYGCTNTTALNYNETATHDDGTCEYPQEEEEITDECYVYFYEVISYWNETNESLYNELDIDFSCMANVTALIKVDVYDSRNETVLYSIEDNYTTYHQEWDFQYLDLYNVEYSAPLNVHYQAYYNGTWQHETWYKVDE